MINANNYDAMMINSTNNTFPFYIKNGLDSSCTTSAKSGVNLNRNFPFAWGYVNDGCSDDYAGPTAGSSPEVSSLISLYRTLKVKSWIHFDGREPRYIVPYSYTSDTKALGSEDLSYFYSDESESDLPRGFNQGNFYDLTNSTANGTLIDFAASNGALAVQIGSSSSSISGSQIVNEVKLHESAVYYYTSVASFSF